MAKKSKNKAATVASADQDIITEAYKDELKIVFHGFHNQCISNTPDAEKDFINGIAILRGARDRALKLI